jgi:iron complex outermembrane recepter protein
MRTDAIRASSSCVIALLLALSAFTAVGSATLPPDQESARKGSLKQLSLEELGNLEVTTASKSPQQVWKTAAAVFVITQEDIRRSGATTIPEALRLAPGVEVARIDGNKWSIGIRGFGSRLSRSVLVLIDGRSIYTTLLAGTYWEVQDTVMEDIDRIEVIRGPGGTVWGPNAVNGVINIITKDSKETHGALATLGGGNEEQGFLNLRYGGGNGKGLNYRVYGKGFNRGPEFHSDGQDFDRWRAAQAGFRMDWSENSRDSLTLQGDLYDEGAGESVQATSYTPPFSQVLNGTALLSGGNLLGRWTRVFHEGEDIQIQGYYDRTNRREPNFGDLRNTFDIDLLHRFRIGSRQSISWGLGARASQGHELEVVSGLTFTPSRLTDQLYTGFLQDNIALIPNRLTLEVGTKLLHTNFTGLEPEPSGRLLWTPTATQTVWFAVTRAVRTPSDGDRNFFLTGFIGITPSGMPFFARFNGNQDFKSENLNGYETGYRRLVGKNFYVDLAGFFNNYHDLFSEDIIGAPFVENTPAPTHLLLPAQFGNGLLGSTTGGEVAPDWKITNFWRLSGSYSFLHMSLRKGAGSLDVGSAPSITGSSPQHQVLVKSSFDLPKRFTLDLASRYVSALPAQSVAAYFTGDARLAWSLGEHFECSLVGSNLFQPSHIENSGEPGPPVAIKRSVFVKLVWKNDQR